jgi:hypothetical protein
VARALLWKAGWSWIQERGAKGADAHDGQTVLQRGKIIAQPSNLGNNSEFSRIGSLISPKRGELIV